MTTAAAECLYEAQHLAQWSDKGWACYNPLNKPVDELPVIYGFNNGGQIGWLNAQLMAEDGTALGGHCCSSESYMPHDLGLLEGARPDRHKTFREHYPDGYRMEFVRYGDVPRHRKLNDAAALNAAQEAVPGKEEAGL